ncbi:hypothetical protein LCGC14_1345770 [marine sediment metagenome]|uniref:Uncharacterized protein n=1 Tax=marine sediment metagenome TaxID=412755 RepID=A0A0F9MT94_9ZZZZ
MTDKLPTMYGPPPHSDTWTKADIAEDLHKDPADVTFDDVCSFAMQQCTDLIHAIAQANIHGYNEEAILKIATDVHLHEQDISSALG